MSNFSGSDTVPIKRSESSENRWTWRDTFYLLGILLLAVVLRTVNLDQPAELYFDEIYYVDAAEKLWAGEKDPNSVHPPLGKWIIASGIAASKWVAGPDVNKMVSWRIASVIAGLLMVVATYSLSLMLYQYNRMAALAAGVFVATEHLHLSMTRIAMLDPFLALFCLLGTWWSFAYFLGSHERWAILGAFSFGLATGCKWSGLLTAFGCFLACLFLDRYHSLDTGWQKSQRYFCWLLLFLPVGFFLSYTHLFLADGFNLESLKTIFGQGERMVKFRYNPEEFVHGYKSYFWQWPLVFRPIWIFYEQESARVVGICSLGVWTTWWAFTVLLIQRGYAGLVQKKDLIGGALVLVWIGQWLPWAASTTGGFFYYMLPEVPIMALMMGKWFADLFNADDHLGEGRWRGWLFAGVYLLGFVLYYPFASGLEMSRTYFDMLFFLPDWI
jgi:dolichyl-phosphate-mannose-protein mannosyltransferase